MSRLVGVSQSLHSLYSIVNQDVRAIVLSAFINSVICYSINKVVLPLHLGILEGIYFVFHFIEQ